MSPVKLTKADKEAAKAEEKKRKQLERDQAKVCQLTPHRRSLVAC